MRAALATAVSCGNVQGWAACGMPCGHAFTWPHLLRLNALLAVGVDAQHVDEPLAFGIFQQDQAPIYPAQRRGGPQLQLRRER